ncbi:MAG: DUF488 domain-containing protein [Thermodesulfobacteriota bacterium]
MKINIKRAYDPYSDNEGFRILVDRLWPRGVKKEDLKLDLWAKEIAPSDKLRKWFSHDLLNWEEFQKKYNKELDENITVLKKILSDCGSVLVTLIYSAKNTRQNQAVVIKKYIEDNLNL